MARKLTVGTDDGPLDILEEIDERLCSKVTRSSAESALLRWLLSAKLGPPARRSLSIAQEQGRARTVAP
jgi:hypothetical protein